MITQILIPVLIAGCAGVIIHITVGFIYNIILKFVIGITAGAMIVYGLNRLWNKGFLMELRGMVRR